MYKVDNHVHTRFSMDGMDHIYKVIEKSLKMDVDFLTITDHLEYNAGEKFSLDLNAYINKIIECKEKYKGKIELLTGVEVGYQSHIKEEIDIIVNSYPFDFVICSTHTIEGKSVSRSEYFEGMTKKGAIIKYYESILKTVKEFDNYDIYGHLDYVRRYAKFDNKRYEYGDYKNIIDEILKEIVYSGKGIEVNTSGYRYKVDSTHPTIEVLKRFKELGGEIITIGSDAHRASDICKDFDKVYDILEDIGYKYLCIYEKRNPKFLKLDSISELIQA